ncbi:uncharacterized protein TRUGW13939_08971 [Talaromyces rugulosus]|uniref:Nitroreductase domain-containing protein n=1 Tax=Talaromyces rugulosus TaxID=121627 RepID=A0A7H8R870_TALRU|nr:uncharacterized protein TRUGW13939_08971 [Talaromyces rugulosus]QKX61815.1 hypothetical protein TRUGW13939_08971 [Talaromyces rugulosus]
MTPKIISTDQWLVAAKLRRSVYNLTGTSSVSDSRIENILQQVLSFAPSSYNTQPVRLNLITGEKHKQFWDTIIKTAEPILKDVGEGIWHTMGALMESQKAAYGSVVFWERGDTIREASETHKSAAHMIPQLGDHANGMAQILAWTALELEGLGASLQHMQAIPVVETALREFCGMPDDCSLKAHLTFGDIAGDHPIMPDKLPFSETLKIIK